MNYQALYHEPNSSYAYAYTFEELHIRFRSAKGDLDCVQIISGIKYDWINTRKEQKMELLYSDEYFDYYQIKIIRTDTRYSYFFKLIKEEEVRYYTEAGIVMEFDENKEEFYFFTYPYIHSGDVLTEPKWLKKAVFYQIYVDSFCNGKPDHMPENHCKWEETPEWNTFLGGDLEGIRTKLPYLVELGINAVYLTPVFRSSSTHKYNTSDYKEIDLYFGTKEEFKNMIESAHSMGIKIVLDAVFNHCGTDFMPFQDVLRAGKNSKYWDWFFIEGESASYDPLNYKTFAFTGHMPKLNTANHEVRKYLLDVVMYWTKEFNIDGWRLDVADEIEHNFWRDFRRTVKAINQEAVIIGESWHNTAAWLTGDQFDSVMHYPVMKLILDYFARGIIRTETFKGGLVSWLIKYQKQATESVLNFLDSHDVSRFLTSCNNEEWRLRNAAAFLFAYEGMPCIYYGTEIGMTGENGPACRRGFDWDSSHWNHRLYEYYKRLINLRNTEEELTDGELRFLQCTDLFGMERSVKGSRILVLINQTEQVQEFSFADYKENLLQSENLEEINTLQIQSLLLGDLYELNQNRWFIPPRSADYIKIMILQ